MFLVARGRHQPGGHLPSSFLSLPERVILLGVSLHQNLASEAWHHADDLMILGCSMSMKMGCHKSAARQAGKPASRQCSQQFLCYICSLFLIKKRLFCRGGKHEREYRDEDYYGEEGAAGGKGGEGGPPKRRRRASPSRSPSPSKSRCRARPSTFTLCSFVGPATIARSCAASTTPQCAGCSVLSAFKCSSACATHPGIHTKPTGQALGLVCVGEGSTVLRC